MTRTGVSLAGDPRIEEGRRLIQTGMPYKEAAKTVGVSFQTLYRYVPRDVASESMKSAILAMVQADGPFANPEEIVERLRPAYRADEHNVVHLLFSLQKQGLVAFRQERSGSRHDRVYDIRTVPTAPAIARSKRHEPVSDAPSAPVEAEPVPEPAAPEEPAPETIVTATDEAPHPLLDQLRRRRSAYATAVAKAEEAVALLRDAGIALDGFETATIDLMESEPTFTPLEDEYLRYAASHS